MLFEELKRLVICDTSDMDEEEKRYVVALLKDIFNFSKTVEVLQEKGVIYAVLFGINCNLYDVKDSVLFSGHIDTVPGRKACFCDDTCLFGRGTSDMKSFFPCLKRTFENLGLTTIDIPLIVAISFDEEVGNKGIKAIKNYLLENRCIPKYCIVGEPTSSSCSLSSFGCYDKVVTIKCTEHHIINNSESDCFDVLLSALYFLNSTKNNYEETSIKITFINGGERKNVSPAECVFGFQIRTMNYRNVISICESFENFFSDTNHVVVLENCDTDLPPFENSDSLLANIVRKYNGNSISIFHATTEAGEYHALGIDTVICGPGDILLAHTPNEHINYSDMINYVQLMVKVLEQLNQKYAKRSGN